MLTVFLMFVCFFNTFWPLCNRAGNAIGLLRFPSIWSRGADMKTKESLYVFMQTSLTPPLVLCPCCWSTRAHTNTHRHRSSRRTLPAMPSVASWRFTSQSHRPVSGLLPLPSTPRCRGHQVKPVVVHSDSCLPHTWPPGNYEKIPPTPSSRSKGRSQHIIFVGSGRWLLKSVINHHRTMLKLIHTPKLN